MLRLSAAQRQSLKQATSNYANQLPESPAAEYLENRGLLVPGYGLGYVKDPLPGHEAYTGYLAIPYLRDTPGVGLTVASIRFRCIRPGCEHAGHGKYTSPAGSVTRLYNTRALTTASRVVAVTEGELDAVTATECGLPAVGVPGAENWKPHYREPLLGYDRVYILADGDEPGERFATKVSRELANSVVIRMPPGDDTNSLVVREGRQALLDRIE